ncbi:hypothetical protein LWI28_014280 [Acer negundo]|uniref:Serine/threonine-protein kinase PRP4 homolog n=1 Tax=Acer negundo TaxID=4023 RepID=A0AAD5NMM5_ACENE|nr:hypothetical protein LWI28_014280 [Acer negundo]
MASDAQQKDPHRKHRRSTSDDETDKSVKRRKHRQHHHHRHRHHRSRKHEEESNHGVDDIALPVSSISVANDGSRIDDDVEEGEILEEDNIEAKGLESGAFEASVFRDGTDSRNPGVGEFDDVKEIVVRKTEDVSNSCVSEKIHDECHVNGDFPFEYLKENNKQLRDSRSPSKRSSKPRSYPVVDTMENDEGRLSDRRKSLSSESSGDKYKKSVRSPLQDRSCDEVHMRRSRSRSYDFSRERSRSRSVMEEEALLKKRRHHVRVVNDTDDERVIQRTRNEQHGSRDLVRDGEREYSTSYSSKYIDREDRHYSREIRDRERSWERETERERKREKEQTSRRNMETEKDWRRDREGERNRDREIYSEREGWDRSRYEEEDVGRKRDKERGQSRDRARASDRDIDRQRGRERERERERDRVRERDLERERERRNDRGRDKGRDIESDREKYASLDDGYGNRDRNRHSRHSTHDDDRHYWDRTRKNDLAKVHGSSSYSFDVVGEKISRDEDEQDDFEERVALKLVEQEEEDLNRIKEESRKRRQAILEKYKNLQIHQQNESRSDDVEKDKKPEENHGQLTGADNNLTDNPTGISDGVDIFITDQLFSVKKSPPRNGVAASEQTSAPGGLGDGTPKSETLNNIFCDDIFGETPTGVRKTGKAEGLKVVRSGLHDNWDDAEGYYSYRFGEMLDGRYEVTAAHGKGVFSTVVRAKDLKGGIGEPEEVAIKIIRNNETMNKAGQTEVQILKKLAGADPENKRHCVCFISSFKYRNHLCLVFESLHMNLREVLKKFGRNIGLKLTAVRAYSKQLFIALKHLKNCGVLHCDIKPDNMLVNEAKNVLKLCDFGNAMFAGKNEITPYLVSRFYRAPEIILGLPYDHPLDIWSVGCCLYELYTGKVLFPGATNNDMLRLHMELKGPFPKKMLRKGGFTDQHFDQDMNFHATEEDPVTKKTIKRMIFNIKPKDIGTIVTSSPGEDPKMLANFKDLLDKIFVLDPEKRMTVAQALTHPFISEHSVGMVEVKGDDVCLEYSVLAVLSVECTVSIDICHCFEAILQCLDA